MKAKDILNMYKSPKKLGFSEPESETEQKYYFLGFMAAAVAIGLVFLPILLYSDWLRDSVWPVLKALPIGWARTGLSLAEIIPMLAWLGICWVWYKPIMNLSYNVAYLFHLDAEKDKLKKARQNLSHPEAVDPLRPLHDVEAV